MLDAIIEVVLLRVSLEEGLSFHRSILGHEPLLFEVSVFKMQDELSVLNIRLGRCPEAVKTVVVKFPAGSDGFDALNEPRIGIDDVLVELPGLSIFDMLQRLGKELAMQFETLKIDLRVNKLRIGQVFGSEKTFFRLLMFTGLT